MTLQRYYSRYFAFFILINIECHRFCHSITDMKKDDYILGNDDAAPHHWLTHVR